MYIKTSVKNRWEMKDYAQVQILNDKNVFKEMRRKKIFT